MGTNLFAAFLVASATLILIPGPNVGLIVSNSLRFGTFAGIATVLGTNLGILIQLSVVCLGMSSVLAVFSEGFEIVRWLGVAYLVYLGLGRFQSREVDLVRKSAAQPSRKRFVYQGLFIALANPKTLLFFAAFLPQFIDPDSSKMGQLSLLSSVFAGMALVLDSGYALLAGRLQKAIADPQSSRWFNRLSGSILIGSGLGLALARVK